MPIPHAKKVTLDNGFRIITEEIPSVRSLAMGILVNAGSGYETKEESGYSHLIEHLTFKGTKKRSAFEISRALDAVGARVNAYTGKEHTMYYTVVLDKHIDIAIDVLCDIFIQSVFDPQEMEMEKKVILEEINMYEDTPDELIHDFFTEKILHGHPIGLPTIGTKKSIKEATRESIKTYRKKWYTPGNIIISLAGAIPKDIIPKLKPYFEIWKRPQAVLPPTPPQIKGGIFFKKKKTEQVHLCLGVKGVSQVDEERYPYAILDNVLGGSMSSRLFQEVREKRGLAYSIFSTSSPFRDFGISYVYAGTSNQNLRQVVDIILEQFHLIKRHGFYPDELERGKEYLKGSLVLGLESTSSRMSWLGRSESYYNRVVTIEEIFEQVDKVSNDDIIKLAAEFFRDEYLTLAVIGDMDKLPIKEVHC